MDLILVAYLLDMALGDPPGIPHPVRLIGGAAARLEGWLRTWRGFPGGERALGLIFWAVLVLGTWAGARLVLGVAAGVHAVLGMLAAYYLAYTTLAARDLERAVRGVLGPLERGELPEARARLAHLVGRDTENLNEAGICRALVETVAENASDGFLAPLFYLALGGPVLALMYKAVNTCDSMVGYRNDAYREFGYFSARLDDAANFIPARLTGLLLVWAAYLTGHDAARAWEIMCRDAGRHTSPNAGVPEAAAAGALGVKLGGQSSYFGQVSEKPEIHPEGRTPEPRDVTGALRLMQVAALLGVVLAVAALGVGGGCFFG